ncbi:unnamed protein product [Heligmosomoides polygyrus]|uniref:Reverse transcriptase domain-containing protein n=1 Tax=Heligmosomoides polygyrus TaxID=6339 RepID=A0A183FVK3_HELPZ|nr:unnamed protein product [Heligmosomoides polygyrus]
MLAAGRSVLIPRMDFHLFAVPLPLAAQNHKLIERSHQYHIPLVLVFVNYPKVFESVEINAIPNAPVHAGAGFIKVTADAMKNFNWDDKGYLADGKRLSNLRFADDIVLISTSTAEVEEMLWQVKDAALRPSIFNSSILPAMCYATENWPDNKTIARAMQTERRALERCLLRTSLRQQWQEGLRSSELPEKSQLADPLQYMKKSKYRWAGHLLRRKDDR